MVITDESIGGDGVSAWNKQRDFIMQQGWFDQHIAVMSTDGRVLNWRAPKSSICWMRFIINERHLIVIGDLGDAIYEWSSALSFEWLAGLEGGYFMEKCQASEVGSRYVEWCAIHARQALNAYFKEYPPPPKLAKAARDAAADHVDWTQFMNDDDGAYALFGDGYTEMGGIGWIPNLRCVAHLEGLRMAVNQLKYGDVEP